MGLIKRILRRTSHKILTKLGAQRNSHQLVLNAPVATQQVLTRPSKGRSRKAKKIKKSTIPEALLLAAKNYLPPVQFHHVHGPNAQLSKNKFVARRTQSFCQALVFSNRVILPNERVYIKVLEIAKGWSGTIRFGFTSVDPATLRYQMPKHACPDMTNAGHTWARALADEVVRRNSVIHFSYNTNGYIHYGINNQDCGIFYANVNTSQHLWFIVDIYGLTAAVELIDPRIHNATSELDFSRLDDDSRIANDNHDRSIMYKSTGAMDDLIASHYGAHLSRGKKKRGRKAPRHSTLIYEQWPPENLLMASSLGFSHPQRPNLLPNLSSIILPTAQQNIYSPMPNISERPPPPLGNLNESHDYYQIMTNSHANESHPIRATKMSSAAAQPLPSSVNMARMSTGISSALNSSPTSSNARSRAVADEQEICQQLDSLQMSDINGQQQRSTSKSPKSTSITNALPVAAVRRRQQNNLVQTNLKRTPEVGLKDQTKITHMGNNSPNLSSSSITKAKSSTSSAHAKQPKARHSTRTTKSSSSRDNNNNSPPSKDCPICFERPINCVLYQCGHMCTCYECGVKQWRTQSRTCPICRTVIKDVIKTYMS